MKKTALILSLILIYIGTFGQNTDKAIFKEYAPNSFMNMIMMDNSNVERAQTPEKKDKIFFMDQSNLNLPNKIEIYKDNTVWHTPTISQGRAGSCWCYSTTSF